MEKPILSFELSEEMAEWLEEYSEVRDISKSDIVMLALRAEREKQEIREYRAKKAFRKLFEEKVLNDPKMAMVHINMFD